MKTSNRTRLLAVALLTLLLSACTVTIRPGDVSVRGRVSVGIELSNIITDFEPTRGEGATYYVGENISFEIYTTRDGYITLTAIDPDGSVYVFARNIFVRGGRTNIISGPSDRFVFSLQPPRGLHRVRASFTPSPTSGTVTYRGRHGEDVWTQAIVTEIEPYPTDARDIDQTYFYLR